MLDLRTRFRRRILRPHQFAQDLGGFLASFAQLLDAMGAVVIEGDRWQDIAAVLTATSSKLRVLWHVRIRDDGTCEEIGPDGYRTTKR